MTYIQESHMNEWGMVPSDKLCQNKLLVSAMDFNVANKLFLYRLCQQNKRKSNDSG